MCVCVYIYIYVSHIPNRKDVAEFYASIGHNKVVLLISYSQELKHGGRTTR